MSETDELELEHDWEMPLPVVAGIFAGLEWKYDILDEGLKVPDAETIQALIEGLVNSLQEGDGTYVTLGRVLVLNDPDFPCSYDYYLKIGHCSPRIPAGSR